MMRLFRRKEVPSERLRRMLTSRAAVMSGDVYAGALQQKIDKLLALRDRNNGLRELSGTVGWQEIEEELSFSALTKLKGLPKLVIAGEWEKASAHASYITFVNEVLGLVSEPLLESARVTDLINTRLAAQRQYEEEQRARQDRAGE